MSEQQEKRLDLNWVQVSASALAAVSSAVLLSTVGVAGTLMGAAVGSVIATVGNAIYAHYLDISRERVAAAQASALMRVSRARARASVSGARASASGDERSREEMDEANRELEEAQHDLEEAEEAASKPSWREAAAGLPWKRIAIIAAGVFLAAMVAIVTFELVTGRAVSTYTGGTKDNARTSIPGLGAPKASDTQAPSPTATSSAAPTTASAPTVPAPTTSAAPTPTARSAAPTAVATSAVPPSAAATTAAPSATPSPTPLAPLTPAPTS